MHAEYAQGSVVILVSGSPPMVVREVVQIEGAFHYRVVWADDIGQLQKAVLPEGVLRPYIVPDGEGEEWKDE